MTHINAFEEEVLIAQHEFEVAKANLDEKRAALANEQRQNEEEPAEVPAPAVKVKGEGKKSLFKRKK